MRRGQLGALALVALGLALGACAAAPPPPPPVVQPPPAPPPGPTVTPESPPVPPPPSPLETLLSERRGRAQEAEQAGRLHQALLEWKVALTIKPDDAASLAGKRALEARLERAVADRIRQGREALAKGDHVDARRHFLVALSLDPDNRTAFEALQSEVQEQRFVNHVVRRGDTLASIAERYYGDRVRSEVIWEVNQLPANPRLVVGSVLKIPEIPGVPFVVQEARPAPEPSRPEAPRTDPGGGGQADVYEANPLLASAKEALDRGDYGVALGDVERLLASSPGNSEGTELRKQALYGLGKAQLGQRKLDESYRTLAQLVALAPNYQDAGALLRQARERLVQQHYSQGLRLFQEEKLDEAIGQWRVVLELDPQHATARTNIERAERMLKNLQQRQQPKRP